MNQTDTWRAMSLRLQLLHSFCRRLQTLDKPLTLTGSELELLSHLYFSQKALTPLCLSGRTGMKTAAVSRTLKSLYEKGLIEREKDGEDERSYLLQPTEKGVSQLCINYQRLLGPVCYLEREMGPGFSAFMEGIAQAEALLKEYHYEEEIQNDLL